MFEIVRVVVAHPEANSVDVVVMRTGAKVCGVQVLAATAGSAHGVSGIPQPAEQSATDPFSAPIDPQHVIFGLMLLVGVPLLLFYLPPQVSQLLFSDKNRFIWRHPSDVYFTATDNGDFEVAHPSGMYFRVGVNPDHEDLTGRDYDAQWAIKNNTGTTPTVRLSVGPAGSPDTVITIAPGGVVTVACKGNLAATVGGTAAISSTGAMTLHSDDSIALSAPRIDFN